MKKADRPVIIVYGDNNKVNINESKSHFPVAVVIALSVVVAAAVLAVSFFCPESLADFVRWILSIAVSG